MYLGSTDSEVLEVVEERGVPMTGMTSAVVVGSERRRAESDSLFSSSRKNHGLDVVAASAGLGQKE